MILPTHWLEILGFQIKVTQNMEHTPKVTERTPCRRYDLILNQLNSVFLRWSVKTVSPAVSKAALFLLKKIFAVIAEVNNL